MLLERVIFIFMLVNIFDKIFANPHFLIRFEPGSYILNIDYFVLFAQISFKLSQSVK